MRVIVCSDIHADAGSHLGIADPAYGNTRLRDHKDALERVATAAADAAALVIGGDVARTPRPAPLVLRVMIDALRAVGCPVHILAGNHDHVAGEQAGPHQVLARGLRDGHAHVRPEVITLDCGLQIAFLPWTPPNRMFEQAPNDPRELYRLVGDKLCDVAVGLAEQIDPSKPSMLVAHWTPLYDGLPAVIAQAEPTLDVRRLDALPFDVCLFGHWHHSGRISERCYCIGPPLRGSFGEAEIDCGYLTVEWREASNPLTLPRTPAGWVRDVRVEHHAIPDRSLLTFEVDVPEVLARGVGGIMAGGCDGAIVRLRYACSAEQAKAMVGPAAELVEAFYAHGALNVVGPEVTVIREEREARADNLISSTDPLEALDKWLVESGVPEASHDAIRTEARGVVDD